jgi:hypothetical protein
MNVDLVGKLWGQRIDRAGNIVGEIIHISSQQALDGPAENAFVYIELESDHKGRARYVSWINYYDIEYADRLEPGGWRVIEPPDSAQRSVDWHPYGWGGALLPNVAYESHS